MEQTDTQSSVCEKSKVKEPLCRIYLRVAVGSEKIKKKKNPSDRLASEVKVYKVCHQIYVQTPRHPTT